MNRKMTVSEMLQYPEGFPDDFAADLAKQPESKTVKATKQLIAAGAYANERGWFQDGVFLADNARDALAALNG